MRVVITRLTTQTGRNTTDGIHTDLRGRGVADNWYWL